MSLQTRSLGQAAAVARGLTISTTTNATPIVATLGAGHRQKNGDRIAITGITGNTNANGEWTLEFTGANTAKLLGSKGNGAHGGSPVVSALCDVTPFLPRHKAVAQIYFNFGTASPNGVTAAVHGSDDNSSFAEASDDGALSGSGAAGITPVGLVQVTLKKYMILTATVWTAGTVAASLMA